MLFVPDEDYVRLPDYTSMTSSDTGSVAATAADDGDDDDDDGEEDKDVDDNDVSTSILFASQAQYLGHSNQVGVITATQRCCQ